MTLTQYLRLNKITDAEFATAVGFSLGAVRKWRNGERKPSFAALQRISGATHNAVTADDFFKMHPAAPKRAA